MKIECPECGYIFSFEDFCQNRDLVRAVMELSIFGKWSALVMEYVELFGIFPMERNSKKILRLVLEIKEIWQVQKFSFNRKIYEISNLGMADALRTICNKKLKGLYNHNYLKKIMVDIAEQELKTKRIATERKWREREDKLRIGIRDPEETRQGKEQMKRLREAAEGKNSK